MRLLLCSLVLLALAACQSNAGKTVCAIRESSDAVAVDDAVAVNATAGNCLLGCRCRQTLPAALQALSMQGERQVLVDGNVPQAWVYRICHMVNGDPHESIRDLVDVFGLGYVEDGAFVRITAGPTGCEDVQ